MAGGSDADGRRVQELVHRWQMAGGPPPDADTASEHPWRTILVQRPWHLALRAVVSGMYVAVAVMFVTSSTDLAWLWVVLAVVHVTLPIGLVVHERRLVDVYPAALVAFEEAGGTDVAWHIDESSAYHPVNLRLAQFRRSGGPTPLQAWSARSPRAFAAAVTLAWCLPVLVGLGVVVAVTGAWAWAGAMVVVALTGVLGFRSLLHRAATTATALVRFDAPDPAT